MNTTCKMFRNNEDQVYESIKLALKMRKSKVYSGFMITRIYTSSMLGIWAKEDKLSRGRWILFWLPLPPIPNYMVEECLIRLLHRGHMLKMNTVTTSNSQELLDSPNRRREAVGERFLEVPNSTPYLPYKQEPGNLSRIREVASECRLFVPVQRATA